MTEKALIRIQGDIWVAKVPAGCRIMGFVTEGDSWFVEYEMPEPPPEEVEDDEVPQGE